MLKRIFPLLGILSASLIHAASGSQADPAALLAVSHGSDPTASASFLKKSGSLTEYPSISAPDSLIRLSSGDQLRLRWWGIGNGELDLVVDTRGDLVIPDMGRISTRDRNFRELRDSIEGLLKRRIKPSLIDLQILKINKAKVLISGLVSHPGVVECPAGTRVIEALKEAGFNAVGALDSLNSDLPGLYYAMYKVPSVRKVLLVRGGRDTIVLDLARALRAGDASQNPPLFDGDAIRIQARDALVTFASGGYSGYMEMLPGEKISDLLQAAGETDVSQPVELMNKHGDVRKVQPTQATCDTNLALVRMPLLHPVFLPPVVWVVGQVVRPGAYAYSQGMKSNDLVKLAGGIIGGEDSGVVVSTKRGWNWLAAAREKGLSESYQLPELKVAMVDYLNHVRGNYSNPNEVIQVGDTVCVYKAEQVVWVGGKVNRPGFVPWKKGADVNHYVQAAGGYALRAWEARTQVFDWSTLQSEGLDQPIRPSAAIIVPEERFISADQWISISATVASLFISVASLMIQVSK